MITLGKKISLYFNTLRYLKTRQIYYQIFYRLKRFIGTGSLAYHYDTPPKTFLLVFTESIEAQKAYEDNTFTFLNKKKDFGATIDWNYDGYGKLWTYNLNYFEFLNQGNIFKDDAIKLLNSFVVNVAVLRDGLESYPASLRGINWIKFFSTSDFENKKYSTILLRHYNHLVVNLEYHLLGNHLLENGFSLLFGAYFFRNETFYRRAKKILEEELNEQILKDGAHFELSPMYHQIILFRLLDCINLLKNNHWKKGQLLPMLEEKAQIMLGWLNAVTFNNGDIPMVNDAAYDIAPTTQKLMGYSGRLGINASEINLNESGYRMIRKGMMELFIDIGKIGPDYIPGHAHSDTFNFLLYIANQPIIVEAGTSTYEEKEQRQIERSTQSHNTVVVNQLNQSDVWGGFRVGRRANVISITENENEVIAAHDGYKRMGIIHTRKWFYGNDELLIQDEISGFTEGINAVAYIHFHPKWAIDRVENGIVDISPCRIYLEGHHSIEIIRYSYALGFNKVQLGKALRVHFNTRLDVRFKLNA